MSILTGKMTTQQFLSLPEDPNKTRYELVHGEVVVSPSPNLEHDFASIRLLVLLAQHVDQLNLGRITSDVDTPFGPEDVRRPDISFYSRDRMHFVGRTALSGPPDLCVEILSPSNRHVDRGDKFDLYRDSGVPYYWIIDPMMRTVEAYRLEQGKYVEVARASDGQTVHLPPFEDLAIDLGRLWAPDPQGKP